MTFSFSKDRRLLRHFLGLEIVHTSKGLFLYQKKETFDLIHEHNLSDAQNLKVPMDTHISS